MALVLAAAISAIAFSAARACPYCSALAPTLTEQFEEAATVVIAQLVEKPKREGEDDETYFPGLGEEVAPCKFNIVEVLKGEKELGDIKQVEAVYFGDAKVGTRFLLSAIDGPPLVWGTPTALTDRSRQYILDLMKLPKKGPDRLAFMQQHLEDSEEMIMRDAYDEFAIASYDDLKALAPRMDREQIVKWLENPDLSPTKKSLYLTMLSVCGNKSDLPMLENMLKAEGFKTSLDATIGCYLSLRGPEGLQLIQDLFLRNVGERPTEAYAALRAVRLSYDEKIIDREAALGALRLLLDHPKYADLVLADLARLEDWSVLDRATELFKTSDKDNSFIRPSVLRYFYECPLPAAKATLAELEKIDPNAARQARASLAMSGGADGTAKVPGGAPLKKPGDKEAADADDAKASDKEANTTDAPLGKVDAENVPVDDSEAAVAAAKTSSGREAKKAAVAPFRSQSKSPLIVGVLVAAALVMLVYGVVVAKNKPHQMPTS